VGAKRKKNSTGFSMQFGVWAPTRGKLCIGPPSLDFGRNPNLETTEIYPIFIQKIKIFLKKNFLS
jgi:hypothetical protein